METKNYTEVLIDGKIYTMGGYEEEGYLQRVASYLNSRIGELKQQSGFVRLPAELRTVQIYLNLTDDYFKAKKVAEDATRRLEEQERELYRLKHELVTAQMKLEQFQEAAGRPSGTEQTEYRKERPAQQDGGSGQEEPSQPGRPLKYHGKKQGGHGGIQKKQYLPAGERTGEEKQ